MVGPPPPAELACSLIRLGLAGADALGNSFVAGTTVETPTGRKRIETLRIGDEVISRNEVTGETQRQQITDILEHVASEGVTWLTLQRVSASGEQPTLAATDGSETFGVTAAHPIHTPDRGWVQVRDLGVGDRVDSRDGVLVVSARWLDSAPQTVYNLSVANDVSYLIGTNGLWVHNGQITVGDVTINWEIGDHGPPHVDVRGGGQKTKVGMNGKPIKGNCELSPKQLKAVLANKREIRKANKWMMKNWSRTL